MAEPDDLEDELDPFEVIADPVAITGHDPDPGTPSAVRLFFSTLGGQQPVPGGELSDVVVFEDWDRVAIGLRRRRLVGDAPNGEVYGAELLVHGSEVSIDVLLARPLGGRPLIDSTTGERVERVNESHATDVTPVWRP